MIFMMEKHFIIIIIICINIESYTFPQSHIHTFQTHTHTSKGNEIIWYSYIKFMPWNRYDYLNTVINDNNYLLFLI